MPQCTFTANNSIADRVSALERRNNSWSFWAKLTGVCVAVGTFGAGYLWWRKAPMSSNDLTRMTKNVEERIDNASVEIMEVLEEGSERVQQQHQEMVDGAHGKLVNVSKAISRYADSTAAQMAELETDMDGKEIAEALTKHANANTAWAASLDGQMEGFEQAFEQLKKDDEFNKKRIVARQTQLGSGIDSLGRAIVASHQTQRKNHAAEDHSLALLNEAIFKQRERERRQEEEVRAQSVLVSHLLLAAKKETQALQLINGSLDATRLMLEAALYSPEPSPRSQFSPNSSPKSLNSALPKLSNSKSPNDLQLGHQEINLGR